MYNIATALHPDVLWYRKLVVTYTTRLGNDTRLPRSKASLVQL